MKIRQLFLSSLIAYNLAWTETKLNWQEVHPTPSSLTNVIANSTGYLGYSLGSQSSSMSYSTDGKVWNKTGDGIFNSISAAATAFGKFYVFNEGKLASSSDGVNWNVQILGDTSVSTHKAAFTFSGTRLQLSQTGDENAFWTTEDGSNWTKHPAPSYQDFKIGQMFDAEGNMYSHVSQTIYKSSDGFTWSHYAAAPRDLEQIKQINGVFYAINTCGYDYDTAGYYSSSDLIHWDKIGEGRPNLWGFTDGKFWANDNGNLLTGGAFGSFIDTANIFSSQPDGFANKSGTDRIFFDEYGSVLHSTDAGKTWVQEQKDNIGDLKQVVKFKDRLYAIGYNGTLTSTDGKNWKTATEKHLKSDNFIIFGGKLLSATDSIYLFDGNNVQRFRIPKHDPKYIFGVQDTLYLVNLAWENMVYRSVDLIKWDSIPYAQDKYTELNRCIDHWFLPLDTIVDGKAVSAYISSKDLNRWDTTLLNFKINFDSWRKSVINDGQHCIIINRGNGDTSRITTNGKDWTPFTNTLGSSSLSSYNVHNLSYNDGKWYIHPYAYPEYASSPYLRTSTDLVNWSEYSVPIENQLTNDFVEFNGKFISVGDNSRIAIGDPNFVVPTHFKPLIKPLEGMIVDTRGSIIQSQSQASLTLNKGVYYQFIDGKWNRLHIK